MKKIAIALMALSTVLFVMGCVDDDENMTGPSAHTYHSKLGRMSTANDTEK